jgi:short-subunit dehydrogenase involved in D-alanine esterification of teichoic acids
VHSLCEYAGGTKGLGKALAREFLTHKDSVIITGAGITI